MKIKQAKREINKRLTKEIEKLEIDNGKTLLESIDAQTWRKSFIDFLYDNDYQIIKKRHDEKIK